MFDKFFDLFKIKVKKPDMKEFVERIKQGQKKPDVVVEEDHAARMQKNIREKMAREPNRVKPMTLPSITPSFYRGSGYNSSYTPYNNSGSYNNNSGMSMGEMIAAGLIIENLVDNNNNSCDNSSSSYDNSSSSCDNSSSDYSSSSDSSSSCDSSSSSDCGSSGGDSGSW